MLNEGSYSYRGVNYKRQNGACLKEDIIQVCCQKSYLHREDKMGILYQAAACHMTLKNLEEGKSQYYRTLNVNIGKILLLCKEAALLKDAVLIFTTSGPYISNNKKGLEVGSP